MAASTTPAVTGDHSNNDTEGDNDCRNTQDNASVSAADDSVNAQNPGGLRHNVKLSVDWSPEEQSTLQELLAKYASETPLRRYALTAQALNNKTVRDVALRSRWMNKKEIGKRRKDDNNSSKKSKDKKEKVPDSVQRPQALNRPTGPPYIASMQNDDGTSFKAIGGTAGQLLEQCSEALDQISSHFHVGKIHENIDLFCRARSNILSVMNEFVEHPAVMKHMPPLPVKLNEELANSILPQMPPPNNS